MQSIQKGCVPFCPKKRDLDHGELLSLYKTFLRNLALFKKLDFSYAIQRTFSKVILCGR